MCLPMRCVWRLASRFVKSFFRYVGKQPCHAAAAYWRRGAGYHDAPQSRYLSISPNRCLLGSHLHCVVQHQSSWANTLPRGAALSLLNSALKCASWSFCAPDIPNVGFFFGQNHLSRQLSLSAASSSAAHVSTPFPDGLPFVTYRRCGEEAGADGSAVIP